ncbi:MAG: aminotransferase class IV [Isosphaeraceae bacterium]
MIWFDGRVIPDDALRVSVLDRTFEHGLGLFETLRTYQGRVPLLARHLERLQRSAHELGLSLSGVRLPGADDVRALRDADGSPADRVVRLTLSGGLDASGGATLWMRLLPLPEPLRHRGAVVDLGAWWIHAHDPFARHKSLNYWSRRRAYESARALGFDEVLSVGGLQGVRTIWEGSRTNLFAVHRNVLMTPALDGPLVPGIMRGLVLERARELSLDIATGRGLLASALAGADEVFLTNSVRGIIPVSCVVDSTGADPMTWDAPGEWTQRLTLLVDDWLRADEDAS